MGSIPSYHSATYAQTCFALRHDWTSSRVPANVGVSSGLNVSPDLMGVGADYTNGLAQTQNYVNQDYELKLDSAINSGTANQPGDRSSKIVIQESFLRNFASMNLQSLVKQQ